MMCKKKKTNTILSRSSLLLVAGARYEVVKKTLDIELEAISSDLLCINLFLISCNIIS